MENYTRDWLVWSQKKEVLCCLLCWLFWHDMSTSSSRSALASPEGWTASVKWQKLSARVSEHERSNKYKECYIAWREFERCLLSGKGVDSLLETINQTEAEKRCNVLKCIIDVVLFLGECGLAFSGSSHQIGDSNNGNILGLIELPSRWDHILQEHVLGVREYQKDGQSLQVHYLSPESQNEFISECSNLVKQHILIQVGDVTLDVEESNIETLLEDLMKLWSNWISIWNEAKEVASNLEMEIKLSHGCRGMGWKRKRMHHDTSTPHVNLVEMTDTDDLPEKAYFRKTVLYVLIDNVVAGLTLHFNAVKWLAENFYFYGNIPQCLKVS